jgi:hypothetical protein
VYFIGKHFEDVYFWQFCPSSHNNLKILKGRQIQNFTINAYPKDALHLAIRRVGC